MAISIRIDVVENLGNSKFVTGTIVWDSSYPTGGESVTINDSTYDVTLERIAHMNANGGGYVYGWDAANQKLKVYRQKDPANAGGADIPLPEVANTTDLSSLTSAFSAVGQ
jgi:hypothetical protein